MTRFKEFARIQAAIKQKNEADLQWAVEYCQMRLRIATRKDHAKYWRDIQREIKDVLRSIEVNE
jgi:Mg2+ and Co2+ transporter CorA